MALRTLYLVQRRCAPGTAYAVPLVASGNGISGSSCESSE